MQKNSLCFQKLHFYSLNFVNSIYFIYCDQFLLTNIKLFSFYITIVPYSHHQLMVNYLFLSEDIQHCIHRTDLLGPSTSPTAPGTSIVTKSSHSHHPAHLRSMKLPVPKTSLAPKVTQVLTELGLSAQAHQRLVMPTRENCQLMESLYEAVYALLETKTSSISTSDSMVCVVCKSCIKNFGPAKKACQVPLISEVGIPVRTYSMMRGFLLHVYHDMQNTSIADMPCTTIVARRIRTRPPFASKAGSVAHRTG